MKFIRSKKFRSSILLLSIFAFLFIATGTVFAEAGDPTAAGSGDPATANMIKKALGWLLSPVTWVADKLVSTVLLLFYNLSGFLLAFAMASIDLVTSSVLLDDVMFSSHALAGINTGWGLVRDFVNMFFILILVFLAIATILRINKFSDKRLLFYVILAALLVNFSKPITVFVIDISNLAMRFFIDNLQATNVSYSTTIMKNMAFSEALDGDYDGENLARYIGLITGAVFKFILAIMLLVLAISLIVRIVALWVLIILSPLAFFGMSLPGTFLSSLKDGWLRKLVYWCFFGPILLFFLWLALEIITAVTLSVSNSTSPLLKFESMTLGDGTVNLVVGAMKIVVPFVAAIYMLFYGYSLTKSMSAGVGGAVLGLMNRGQGFMSRWGKRGAALAGTMATGGLGYLGYREYQAAKKGIQENENIPFTKASREKAEKRRAAYYSGKTPNYEATEVNDQLKKWEDEGPPTTDELRRISQSEQGTKRQAALLRLAKDGEIDANDYRNAMDSLKNNPKLAQRFNDMIKKNNLHAKLEYDIENEKRKVAASQPGGLTPGQEKDIKKKIYEEALNKMSLNQISEQDVAFHNNLEFQEWMRNKVKAGDWKEEDLRKAQNLSAEKREIWNKNNWFA